jgi:phenylalanyl-tRNA synthetase alpha chain
MHPTISRDAYLRALTLRDLTDPAAGPHAMQLLAAAVVGGLAAAWGSPVLVHRGSRVVPVADNYERLGYAADAASRDSRYTRYVAKYAMLRSHTSALVPGALRLLGGEVPADLLIACPGLVWRRDVIDRIHTGEPHQLDLWRIGPGGRTQDDLQTMIGLVVESALPGARWRSIPAAHPYTQDGREIEVADGERWVEVGECGLASPAVLTAAGLPPDAGGLAMGLGLDRLLMLRKGIPDIRLLRSPDPRVAGQMVELDTPYQAVSSMPPVRRDISVAVDADTDDERLGDRVRAALGEGADAVEAVELLSETPGHELPAAAAQRIGIRDGQKNVLLRITIRSHERTLTDAEANDLRNRIYAAVHEGDRAQWAAS